MLMRSIARQKAYSLYPNRCCFRIRFIFVVNQICLEIKLITQLQNFSSFSAMTLLVESCDDVSRKIVSEMTYSVSSGTLNPTIPIPASEI